MPETAPVPPDGTEKVRLRVKQKVDFYGHLAVYVISMGFLVLTNLLTNPDHIWFIWPMFGWGVAILFHFMGTFVFGEGTAIQQRMHQRWLSFAFAALLVVVGVVLLAT